MTIQRIPPCSPDFNSMSTSDVQYEQAQFVGFIFHYTVRSRESYPTRQ